jgi:hypothetical protein
LCTRRVGGRCRTLSDDLAFQDEGFHQGSGRWLKVGFTRVDKHRHATYTSLLEFPVIAQRKDARPSPSPESACALPVQDPLYDSSRLNHPPHQDRKLRSNSQRHNNKRPALGKHVPSSRGPGRGVGAVYDRWCSRVRCVCKGSWAVECLSGVVSCGIVGGDLRGEFLLLRTLGVWLSDDVVGSEE